MSKRDVRLVYLVLFIFMASLLTGLQACGTFTGSVLANAGEDLEVLVGDTVSLDGFASTGVDRVSWTLSTTPSLSVAALSNAGSLTPTFVPDLEGTYVVTLSVNNGTSTDTITITAKNVLASIALGSGTAITTRSRYNATENVINLEQASGVLSASDSRVASGGSIASYLWEQVSGPSATIDSGAATATLTFTAPSFAEFLHASDVYKWQVLPVSRDARVVFRLTVTDADSNTDAETVVVYLRNNGSDILTSSGLPNVGVGVTTILSGPSLKSSTVSITDWAWTLTPAATSLSTFADSGTTSSSIQFPSFVPDVVGTYSVAYTSVSGAVSGTLTINVATWSGVGTIGGTTAASPECGACHDGSVESDTVTSWSATTHGGIFEDSMGLYQGLVPTPFLWAYHTVGYDTTASNSGFDDLASAASFTFPDGGLSYSDFTTNYASVAKLANIQCENCHGPGSEHAGDATKIAVSASQTGVCGQCHIQEDEWKISGHNATLSASRISNAGCVRCHTALGFKQYIEGDALTALTETGAFHGITCAACHDPHDATNTHQLRMEDNMVMVADGSTVDAGKAAVCYNCHDAFYEYDEDDCDDDHNTATPAIVCTTLDQAATQYYRQVHYNPQAPVLEGNGALTDLDGDSTDDFTTENSFHSGDTFILSTVSGDSNLASTNNKCVTCHMSTSPISTADGYHNIGGHSFAMSSGTTEHVEACTPCHAGLTELNRTARADYDGDGTVEGIQDEVKGLLVALTTKIKSLNAQVNAGTTESGGVITVNALGYVSNATGFNHATMTDTIRRGVWNHNLISRDGSLGVHNTAFAIQVLQGTYTAVGGNAFATDYPLATLR